MQDDIVPFDMVIIIDDGELDRYITSSFIKQYNFAKEIVEFSTADKAIEFLKENKRKLEQLHSLILLDIKMPGMNGFEFLEKAASVLYSLKDNCCIVVHSTFLDSASYKGIKNNPLVKKTIVKPLNKGKLEEIKNSCRNT